MPVRLIIDGAAMAEVLRSPEGPVGRYLIRKGDEVIAGARHYIDSRRRFPGQKTGKLARSTVKRFTDTPQGLGMLVISGIGLKPGYAVWVHEGNGPQGSRIFPKKKSMLAFVTSGDRPTTASGWSDARASGRAVIVPSVAASKPNPYLRDALKDAFPGGI